MEQTLELRVKLKAIKVFTVIIKDINASIASKGYKEHEFLCNALSNYEGYKEHSVKEKIQEYFQSQRPSAEVNTKFTKNKYYIGAYVWWNKKYNPNTAFGIKRRAIIISECNKQRILFLEHLITKLKSEL